MPTPIDSTRRGTTRTYGVDLTDRPYYRRSSLLEELVEELSGTDGGAVSPTHVQATEAYGWTTYDDRVMASLGSQDRRNQASLSQQSAGDMFIERAQSQARYQESSAQRFDWVASEFPGFPRPSGESLLDKPVDELTDVDIGAIIRRHRDSFIPKIWDIPARVHAWDYMEPKYDNRVTEVIREKFNRAYSAQQVKELEDNVGTVSEPVRVSISSKLKSAASWLGFKP